MYDNRLEIQSPGGMFEGKPIQECNINTVGSVRWNPVIADLFHRMRFMERRGSGLRKIVSETEKLPGYTEELRPEFHSSGTDFRVVLKKVNYNMITGEHVGEHDNEHVSDYDTRLDKLVDFCSIERSRDEMMALLLISSRSYFQQNILKPLLESGRIKMTIPDKPKSKNQKYIKA
jgi:ATP-dependent DNA helicase RecG